MVSRLALIDPAVGAAQRHQGVAFFPHRCPWILQRPEDLRQEVFFDHFGRDVRLRLADPPAQGATDGIEAGHP
jgi:hypothetical protein